MSHNNSNEDEHFFTLPSSTPGPNNSSSSWETILPHTLTLTGNWQIGLSELVFVNSAYTVPVPSPIEIRYKTGKIERYHLPEGNYASVEEVIDAITTLLTNKGGRTKRAATEPDEDVDGLVHVEVFIPDTSGKKAKIEERGEFEGNPVVPIDVVLPTQTPATALPLRKERMETEEGVGGKEEDEDEDDLIVNSEKKNENNVPIVPPVVSEKEGEKKVEMEEDVDNVVDPAETPDPSPAPGTVTETPPNVNEKEMDEDERGVIGAGANADPRREVEVGGTVEGERGPHDGKEGDPGKDTVASEKDVEMDEDTVDLIEPDNKEELPAPAANGDQRPKTPPNAGREVPAQGDKNEEKDEDKNGVIPAVKGDENGPFQIYRLITEESPITMPIPEPNFKDVQMEMVKLSPIPPPRIAETWFGKVVIEPTIAQTPEAYVEPGKVGEEEEEEDKNTVITPGPPVRFFFDKIKHRVRVEINSDRVASVHFERLLAYLLGFSEMELRSSAESQDPPPVRAGNRTLYVYCDLVSYSVLGHTTANQLRIIPITEDYGSTCSFVANPIRYYDMRTHVISTVKIEIRSEYGDLINFNYGTTVAVVHLRKKTHF